MGNQDSIILQTSSVRQVQYSGYGIYMFRPQSGHMPLTKRQQQEKDDAFKKRLQEAKHRLDAEDGMGGDAA